MALKNRRTQKNKRNRRKQQNKQRKSLRKKRQSRRMRGGSRSHNDKARERLSKAIKSNNRSDLRDAITKAERLVGLHDDPLLKRAKVVESNLIAANKELKANAPQQELFGIFIERAEQRAKQQAEQQAEQRAKQQVEEQDELQNINKNNQDLLKSFGFYKDFRKKKDKV